jgi:hypothetical protein
MLASSRTPGDYDALKGFSLIIVGVTIAGPIGATFYARLPRQNNFTPSLERRRLRIKSNSGISIFIHSSFY